MFVADLHNDVLQRAIIGEDISIRTNNGHSDLIRLQEWFVENKNFCILANILKKLYNSNIGIKISGKYRLGDIRHNYADLTKIKSVLDFKPKIDLITGVSRFAAWAKTQKVTVDKYEDSIEELKQKGLIKWKK